MRRVALLLALVACGRTTADAIEDAAPDARELADARAELVDAADASDARATIDAPEACNPIEAADAHASPCSCTARTTECAEAGYLGTAWPSCAFDDACDGAPFHPTSCRPYRSYRLGNREGCTQFGAAVCCEPK